MGTSNHPKLDPLKHVETPMVMEKIEVMQRCCIPCPYFLMKMKMKVKVNVVVVRVVVRVVVVATFFDAFCFVFVFFNGDPARAGR